MLKEICFVAKSLPLLVKATLLLNVRMGKQEAPFKDMMFDIYYGELQDHTALTASINSVLAEEWTDHYTSTRLSVPRYLAGLEWEVGSILHQGQTGVEGAGNYITRRVLFGEDKDNLFGFLRMILEAKRFQTAKSLYTNRIDDALGIAQISITTQVFSEGLRLVRTKPEQLEEFLAKESFDVEMTRMLHAGLDYAIFSRATATRSGLQFGADITKYASSKDATKAMLGALDSRVLRIAISKKGSDYTEAARIVTEHASSPQAREVMLGHLALRADKTTPPPRSPRGLHYPTRISKEFVDETRASIKTERERVKEEEREDRKRENERRARREEERRRTRREGHAQTNTGDRVADAMSQLDHQFRKTLAAIPRQQVEQAMIEVDRLRKEQPGITPRGIYGYLHHLGTAHNASEQAKTAAQIIGLFMEGRFGKDATLPF